MEQALTKLLGQDELPEYEAVKSLAALPEVIVCPALSIPEPDLGCYDRLLGTQSEVPA